MTGDDDSARRDVDVDRAVDPAIAVTRPTPQPRGRTEEDGEAATLAAPPPTHDVTQTADASGGASVVVAPLRIARYAVTGELGRGGAGVVFRARDDNLQREVALKLVRPTGETATVASRSRARLVREAQALARLAHPNVVTVFDAGDFEGDVYIAMELVDGPTLRGWLRDAEPDWRAVLDCLVATGRGLAAAHAAGFVHRDFKPGNVLIGADGRPRVADFGLARALADDADGPEAPADDASADGNSLSTGNQEITEAGLVMGTPPYMAPEQLLGGDVGPAADQYSFCLTLFEALTGQRPFRQDGLMAQARAKLSGDLPPLPDYLPAAAARAIERGMAPRPDDRWPTMTALLDELERAVAPRRRTWLAIAAVAAVAMSGGAALALAGTGPTCDGTARLDGVWDSPTRAAVVAGLRSIDRGFGDTAAVKVAGRLDDYAASWLDAYRDTCEATHVRGEQSEARLDQRMRCLDDRRRGLAALTAALANAPDSSAVARAGAAVAGLDAPTGCANPASLPPLSAAVVADRQPVYQAIADARADYMLGRFDRARDRLARHRTAIDLLDDDAQSVDALVLRGSLAATAADIDDAERLFDEALERAVALDLTASAAAVAVERFHLVGVQARRPERALGALATTRALVRLAAPSLEANLVHSTGVVRVNAGDVGGAIDDYRRALALGGERGMPRADLAAVETSLGLALLQVPDLDAAGDHLERAHAVLLEELGADHPLVAASWTNLGSLRAQRDDNDGEVEAYRRALDIDRKTHGDRHPLVAQNHANLGLALRDAGDLEAAERHIEQALEIRRAALPADHPDIAASLRAAADLADGARAVELYREAAGILERSLGAEHVRTARMHWYLGRALLDDGRAAEALEALETAGAVFANTIGRNHPDAVDALVRVARGRSALGDADGARRALERAHDHGEAAPLHAYDRAELEFLLADALWPLEGERPRAAGLARAARRRLTEIGERDMADFVGRWLRDRGRPVEQPAAGR